MIYPLDPLSSSRKRGPIPQLAVDLIKYHHCSNAEMDFRLRGNDDGARKWQWSTEMAMEHKDNDGAKKYVGYMTPDKQAPFASPCQLAD